MKQKLRVLAAAAIVGSLAIFGAAPPATAAGEPPAKVECYGCQGCDLVVGTKHVPLYRIPC